MCNFKKLNDLQDLSGLTTAISRSENTIEGFELEITDPQATPANGTSTFSPIVYIKKKGNSGYMVYQYTEEVKITSGKIDFFGFEADLKKLLLSFGEQ